MIAWQTPHRATTAAKRCVISPGIFYLQSREQFAEKKIEQYTVSKEFPMGAVICYERFSAMRKAQEICRHEVWCSKCRTRVELKSRPGREYRVSCACGHVFLVEILGPGDGEERGEILSCVGNQKL